MNAKTSSAGEEEASGTRNETLGEAKRRQVIRVAYVIAALDLTFLFMQMGLMPYLAKSLGLDSVGFGYLQTIFGVLQLVGGYIFGRFADQFGARAALILSCASGSILFLLMTLSTNIPLLFLSRLPGVFMHGIPGEVNRSKSMKEGRRKGWSPVVKHEAAAVLPVGSSAH